MVLAQAFYNSVGTRVSLGLRHEIESSKFIGRTMFCRTIEEQVYVAFKNADMRSQPRRYHRKIGPLLAPVKHTLTFS